nr:prepilin peptidase [Lachnospiraceae bacterium]
AGLLLGWKLILVAFFIGILTGGIYAIVMLAGKKIGRKGHFAFGPYLCVGIGISLFFGSMLLSAYLSLGRRLYGM